MIAISCGSRTEEAFEIWKRAVDAALERRCGMNSDELPDWDWYTAYAASYEPTDAAQEALDELMDDCMIEELRE